MSNPCFIWNDAERLWEAAHLPETLLIGGMRISRELLEGIGRNIPVGVCFRIVARDKGLVTIQTIKDDAANV